MMDSTREPDLVRVLSDVEARLYAQERVASLGEAATVTGPVHVSVKNTSGGTLAAGTAVYATGSVGASGAVEVQASDNTDSATMPALGLLDAELANNGEGSATILGVIRNLDTSSWASNDELYVNGSGALQNTRPTSGLIQKIGRVVRVNASTGEVLVLGAGRSNDVPLPLYVDATNLRVGVGESAPSVPLHVNAGTDNTVVLAESTDGTARVNMRDDATSGNSYVGVGAVGDDLGLWAGNSRRVTVDSSGNVGVGTSGPDALLHLDTSNTTDTELLRLSGAWGIADRYGYITGVTSNDDGVLAAIGLGAASNGSNNNDGGIVFLTTSAADTTVSNLTEVAIIDHLGRVGIGTTSPTYTLQVEAGADGDVFQLKGADDTLDFSVSGGDWSILNSQQSNGIVIYDGTGGIELHYNGAKALEIDSDGNKFIGDVTIDGNTVWHAGNDGSGSGLDADTLDGINSGGFLRSNVADTASGALTFTNTFRLTGTFDAEGVYNSTTASAVNVNVASSGAMRRSTSAAKYKRDVELLDAAHGDLIYEIDPIWYRSRCESDPADWSYYGVLADQVHELGLPQLVHYSEAGEVEGLAYDRLVPFLIHAVRDLKARLDVLENK